MTNRQKNLDNFLAISRFEGLNPSAENSELFESYAARKITFSDYKKICIEKTKRPA